VTYDLDIFAPRLNGREFALLVGGNTLDAATSYAGRTGRTIAEVTVQMKAAIGELAGDADEEMPEADQKTPEAALAREEVPPPAADGPTREAAYVRGVLVNLDRLQPRRHNMRPAVLTWMRDLVLELRAGTTVLFVDFDFTADRVVDALRVCGASARDLQQVGYLDGPRHQHQEDVFSGLRPRHDLLVAITDGVRGDPVTESVCRFADRGGRNTVLADSGLCAALMSGPKEDAVGPVPAQEDGVLYIPKAVKAVCRSNAEIGMVVELYSRVAAHGAQGGRFSASDSYLEALWGVSSSHVRRLFADLVGAGVIHVVDPGDRKRPRQIRLASP
jgi:hypothetical protein